MEETTNRTLASTSGGNNGGGVGVGVGAAAATTNTTEQLNSDQQQQQQQQQSHRNDHHLPSVSPAIITIPQADQTNSDTRVLHTSTGTWLCCVPCYWLNHNNSVHKASLTIATLVVTSLLVASPVLFLISSVPGGEVIRDCFPQMQEKCTYDLDGKIHTVCDGTACKALAAQILSSMDMRISPCQDFYKFACGSSSGMPDNRFTVYSMQANVNLHLQNLLATNTSGWVFEKLGLFYNSCLATNDKPVSYQQLYTILDELGGYLPPSTMGPTDLTPLLTRLYEVNGTPLLDIYLDYDQSDRLRTSIYIDVPESRIFSSILYPHIFRYNRSPESRLVQIKTLLDGFLPKKMIEQQRTSEYHNILSFIASLDKLQDQKKSIHWDAPQQYNISRLQTDYSFIRWEQLFEDVLSINITNIDVLYIVSPSYLTKLEDLMARFQKRIIHNAMLMMYARDVLQNIVNTSKYYHNHLPSFCVQLTSQLYNEPMSSLYLNQFSTFYIRQLTMKVSGLFNRLKLTLANRMKILNWMDDLTRNAALKKLSLQREQYLIWPKLFNLTYIAESMKNIQVDPENFFENVIDGFRQLHKIRSKNRSDKMQMRTYIVNVVYKPQENIILIPIALLTQAYLRDDIPEYVVHSSIGSIFMHSMLHGFDLFGINYDGNGTKTTWFTQESRLGLEARVDCFARQYIKNFLKNKNAKSEEFHQFDWNTTRNENMADVGGLQTAYQTWRLFQQDIADKKGTQTLYGVPLLPKQLFFVIAAQMNCIYQPSEVKLTSLERVNGIMMNSPSFSEAFECPLGSQMNPPKKCSTW